MAGGGPLGPAEARGILDALTDQRRRIADLQDAVLLARAGAVSATTPVVWNGRSNVEFVTRLGELVHELDRAGRLVAESLDGCDRAMRAAELQVAPRPQLGEEQTG